MHGGYFLYTFHFMTLKRVTITLPRVVIRMMVPLMTVGMKIKHDSINFCINYTFMNSFRLQMPREILRKASAVQIQIY